MNLPEKIKRARGGRSYAEIGRAAGCSPENIRKLESGVSEPGFRLGVKLAEVLGVPPEWLVDDSADWPPPAASLDDKIVRAVQSALDPFQGLESLSADERSVIDGLRSRSITGRKNDLGDAMFDAIDSLLNLWDAAHDAGLAEGVNDDESNVDPPNPAGDADADGDRLVRSADQALKPRKRSLKRSG